MVSALQPKCALCTCASEASALCLWMCSLHWVQERVQDWHAGSRLNTAHTVHKLHTSCTRCGSRLARRHKPRPTRSPLIALSTLVAHQSTFWQNLYEIRFHPDSAFYCDWSKAEQKQAIDLGLIPINLALMHNIRKKWNQPFETHELDQSGHRSATLCFYFFC